ncbi:MAG: TolC family protein [Desulfotignum sp.]
MLQVCIRKKIVRAALTMGITAATMGLSGCVLTQPTDPYAPVSPDQTIGSGPRETVRPSPQTHTLHIPIQGPLTIAIAIETAMANNPEIAAVKWEAATAQARYDAARAAQWPDVRAETGWQHHLDDQRLIPAGYNGEPGIFDPDIVRGDLVLRMPLFTGGRISSEIRAAELLRLAEEKRLARSGEALVFNVCSTFYAILSQQEVIRSLAFSVKTMEEHHKQVSQLLAAQKAARVDLLRTKVRLADLRQALLQAQNILAAQKRLLVNMMGVDDPADTLTLKGETVIPSSLTADPPQLVAIALNQRSDYLAARTRLEAQARRVDAARAEYWPAVSLTAGYGVRMAGSGEDEDVGAAGLGLSVPLFDGNRISARIRQERTTLAAGQERLRKLELEIKKDVETAVLDINSSSQRVNAVQQAVEQARESLRIERMKYELNSGSLTDVLDAQSALLQSETNYARAVADFHTAAAKLRLATGETCNEKK